MPETNWRLYCLARHQCPAIIRQQNRSECQMNENSLPNPSSPVSQAEEGMSPSTVPCRGASPLLLHSSLGAQWSRDLQDEGLPARTAGRRHRPSILVMWALGCQARRREGGSGCFVTQFAGTTPPKTLSPASVVQPNAGVPRALGILGSPGFGSVLHSGQRAAAALKWVYRRGVDAFPRCSLPWLRQM